MAFYLIQQLLDNNLSPFKNRSAISSPDVGLTTEELYVSSNRLANCLKDNGCQRQDRVIICLKRSPYSIVAMIGILKADAIYVPVDSNAPIGRYQKIINDCKPAAIICDRTTIEKVSNFIVPDEEPPIIILFENHSNINADISGDFVFEEQLKRYSSSEPIYKNIDTDIAYILYTSGSTGKPKGVMVSHLSVFNYINWAVKCFDITEADVILSTAPFYFDMSVFDIYCALKTGAKLSIATENLLLFPKKLIDFMDGESITIWKGVSSLLMYIARTGSLKRDNLKTLQKILFAGEVLPTKYLIDWMQTYPEKSFYNGYGPTEATGMSTYYQIPETPKSIDEKIPIGKACDNTEVFILNDDGTKSKPGETGEICIRGGSLSSGYWNDLEKTKQFFIKNSLNKTPSDIIYKSGDLAIEREDGNIDYLGRIDDQIKWMGYRIQLGEIENAFLSLDKVKDVSVLLCVDETLGEEQLVAFVEGIEEYEIKYLLEGMNSQIPHYMRPKRIIPVKTMPRNERGKIDKNGLKNILAEQRKATGELNPKSK